MKEVNQPVKLSIKKETIAKLNGRRNSKFGSQITTPTVGGESCQD